MPRDDSDRKVASGLSSRVVAFDFSSRLSSLISFDSWAGRHSAVSSFDQGARREEKFVRESFSDYQWDDRVHPRSSYHTVVRICISESSRPSHERLWNWQTGRAGSVFGRQRRACGLSLRACTPTCATERAAACAHGLKAHGIKSWLWNVLNVIHGSVSGRRYVNQPRWVQSDPRTLGTIVACPASRTSSTIIINQPPLC